MKTSFTLSCTLLLTAIILHPLLNSVKAQQGTASYPEYEGLGTLAYNTNINYQFTNTNHVNEVRVDTRVDATHAVDNKYSSGYFAPVTMPLFPLPVNYLSFDAVVNNNTVTLKWLTAEEINHNYFEVERSFNLNSFSTLGIVLDGFVVNGSDKSYQFKENSIELQNNSMAYYRLRQIDIDGKATYSKVLAVKLKTKPVSVMQVSPNPFEENVHIRVTSTKTGAAQMRITNAVGQIVYPNKQL